MLRSTQYEPSGKCDNQPPIGIMMLRHRSDLLDSETPSMSAAAQQRLRALDLFVERDVLPQPQHAPSFMLKEAHIPLVSGCVPL